MGIQAVLLKPVWWKNNWNEFTFVNILLRGKSYKIEKISQFFENKAFLFYTIEINIKFMARGRINPDYQREKRNASEKNPKTLVFLSNLWSFIAGHQIEV